MAVRAHGRGKPGAPTHRRNADADWDRWPVDAYLDENYRRIHPSDAAVIRHQAGLYRTLAPGSVARSLECGAGPNLYPLMQAAAASRRIDAVEPGASNIAYLTRQLRDGPDPHWAAFYALCRDLDPALPARLSDALARVRVVPGSARTLPDGVYDLASMNFVAESVTEDLGEFAALCRAFIRSVRPGGRLVAAFMENMPSYRIASGTRWPACPVGADTVHDAFAPYTEDLRVTRARKDPTLPDYGDTGMVLLRAVRREAA
ncbi:class I SAM-dependent methyltransferase [Streptomyces ureilyticus]|uniref:Class I SAM-dependent methyltransferase n=1 Tax=Streptomyces ureilyticus TaxID=1775131 RepID=A0ABX0DKX7_9ACTN|nr:class I SAM-dependent methyltransferase [Streptomyces ureilyticus]NGO41079.1 class I SAM-dependent methyltransferase [Streptomyces ureilyticus]